MEYMIGLPDWALYIDDYYLKHMRGLKVFDVSLIICLLLVGCQSRVTRQQDVADILALMRSDSAYIHELDSMATLALGAEAVCIDPVWHLFNCEGGRWFHNPDWGGVLEIPAEFIPQDDWVQAVLSFHGTRAISPDTTVVVSFYGGFHFDTEEEYMEEIVNSIRESSFDVTDVDTGTVLFPDEFTATSYTVRATDGDIKYYGRYIPMGPDGVMFVASVTYQNDDEIKEIIPMINLYPLSKEGSFLRGAAF